jgi:DNA-binding SARP family transcriptional activator
LSTASKFRRLGEGWIFILFNGLKICLDGNPLPPPPNRCVPLLGYLLLNPTNTQRDEIIGTLFPELDEDRARSRLNDYLWALRRSLPDLPLESSKHEVSISQSERWVDVEEFKQLAGLSDISNLEKAIDLYRGDLLPGFYDDWILLEREHCLLGYLQTLHTVVEHYFSKQEYKNTLPLLQQLLIHEPLNETAVQMLMRIHLAEGQRGAAFEVYERLTASLRDDLGIEPSDATKALFKSARSQRRSQELLPHGNPEGRSVESLLYAIRLSLMRGEKELAEKKIKYLQSLPDALEYREECQLLMADFSTQFSDESVFQDEIEDLGEISSDEGKIRKGQQAFVQRDLAAARELAEQVLSNSAQGVSKNRIDSLILLGEVTNQQGDNQNALRLLRKAIALAQELGSDFQQMTALTIKGEILANQGLKTDALRVLRLAEAISLEKGYRVAQLRIDNAMGFVHRLLGRYYQAREIYQQGLKLSRDLENLKWEPVFLQGLATVYDYLGMGADSYQALLLAEDIYQMTCDQEGLAKNYYHLAYALPYHSESKVDEAIGYAEKAIEIFDQIGDRKNLATCQAALGYSCWLADKPKEALQAYQAALACFQEHDAFDYIPEVYAYMALARLSLDQIEQADALSKKALVLMAQGELIDIASELYYARGVVLEALGEKTQAVKHFRMAFENLMRVAEIIEEDLARKAFFERDPTIRRLMDKVYHYGIYEEPADGVVKRHVSGIFQQDVEVTWTVNTGAPDAALKNAKGAIWLRRERLKRLLRESREQGAAPTNKELAEELGVSVRTVIRDMKEIQIGKE